MNNTINFLPVPHQKLTKVEKSIYEFLEKYPSKNFYLNQKQLASNCDVSESAITRFIKKCGFAKYKDFTIWFNHELNSIKENWITFSDINNKNTIADILTSHKFIFEKNINYETINKCKNLASKIVGKKRIIVFGVGTSNLFANELGTNIARLGFPSLVPRDIHSLFPLMGNPNQDEMYILFSSGLKTKEILFLLRKLIEKTNVFIITSNKLKALDLQLEFENIISYTRIHKETNKVSFSSKNASNIIIDMIFSFLIEMIPKKQLESFQRGMNIIDEWNNLD